MLQLARIIYSHTNSNNNGKSIHVARGIRTCGRRICFVYGDVSSDNDLNQLMFIIRNNYQIRVGVRFFSQSKFLHFSLTPFVQDKELISLSLSWALVVAPLVERLLLIPEIRGSNPVIGKLYITY